MNGDPIDSIAAWFAGPKAENAEWFSGRLRQIVEDHYAWRRNYFPEDGTVIGSSLRRHGEPFRDAFEDRLLELLARLKADVPFQSPRYAAHMLAEQTLPGIAGYFAAMLYNPNNVTADVAPVTVRLELEAGKLLSRMIGYGDDAWAHLTSGGTTANLEAMWVARAARYLPWVVRDARHALGLSAPTWTDRDMLAFTPDESIGLLEALWREAAQGPTPHAPHAVVKAIDDSPHNVKTRGFHAVASRLGGAPVLLAPETHHYCFEKILDVLGLGHDALVDVVVDSDFRMNPRALRDALEKLDAQGRHALAVIAVVGSTEEGSIDPVDSVVAIGRQRREEGKSSFWLHADAAYGGYLRTVTIPERCGLGERSTTVRIKGAEHVLPLTLPEHGECSALEAVKHCDSVTIDPHKLGYIPYPAGAICYRSSGVKSLARQEAEYLEDGAVGPESDRASGSIGLYVLEGSKPGAAAAAVWLSHTLIPLDTTGHGLLMRENIRHAAELHALLEQYPAIAGGTGSRAVCLCPPGSNIVCYAFRPQGPADLARINALNRAIFDRFNLRAGQRVYDQGFFVSRTELTPSRYSLEAVGAFLGRLGVTPREYEAHGVFLLRSVLMNPWYSHAKRRGRHMLSELVESLFEAADSLAATEHA